MAYQYSQALGVDARVHHPSRTSDRSFKRDEGWGFPFISLDRHLAIATHRPSATFIILLSATNTRQEEKKSTVLLSTTP
jgi:hypothetical protein